MPKSISIRLAKASEKEALQVLQRRASLASPGDGDAILAHPDAIELPNDQIAAEAGALHLHVVGKPHAAGFYESLGFQTIETVATRFGPGFPMRRNLTAPS